MRECVQVELLYFEGCAGAASALPRLRELLADTGITAQVTLRRIETPEAAAAARFLGSPTIRVDGVDVEPAAGERSDYGLRCRLYRTADGLRDTPPDAWVLAALRAGAAGSTGA
jgi:hypothetical protein